MEQPLYVFKSQRATQWQQIYTGRKQPHFEFRGANPRYGGKIQFFVKEATPQDSAQIVVEDPISGLKSSWNTKVKPGINRKYWTFSLVDPDLCTRQQEVLAKAIAQLKKRVKRGDLIDLLEGATDQLNLANSPEALNAIRSDLVKHFAGYAEGKPLFGDKIAQPQAKPGTYRVTVNYQGNSFSTWLEVRADPLTMESDY